MIESGGIRSREPVAGKITAAVLLLAVLYFGQPVIIPFALSLLLCVPLAPLAAALERAGLGRVIAVMAVSFLTALAVLAVGWLVVVQVRDVAVKMPTYRENIAAKARDLRDSLEGPLGRASRAVQDLRQEITSQPKPRAGPAVSDSSATLRPDQSGDEFAELEEDLGGASEEPVKVEVVPPGTADVWTVTRTLGYALRPLTMIGIAFVLTVFILIWREDLRDRVIRVFGGDDINFTTQALDDAARSVTRYLLMLFVVNTSTGAAVAIGLYFIGVPNAILWGLLFALLRFMPLVGTLIAAALPIALSLAVFDNWTYPILVIALYVTVDVISSNLLEPLLYGAHTGASPLAVLIAVIVWTFLWGPIGLVLAMPLTVSLVALGRYVPQLSFLTVLLGNQPALSADLRLYQRLLALDAVGARRVLQPEAAAASSCEVFERVIMPVLIRAKHDHNRGALVQEREEFLRETIGRMIDEVHEYQVGKTAAAKGDAARENGEPAPVSLSAREVPPLLCVPAYGRYDELAASMLAHILAQEGLPARVVSRKLLAGELLQTVDSENTRIICIAAIGEDGKSRARYLVKRLSKEAARVDVIVGLWGAHGADSYTAEQFALGGRVEVACTCEQIRQAAGQRAIAASLAPPKPLAAASA